MRADQRGDDRGPGKLRGALTGLGRIVALLDLLDEHTDPIAYDCLRHGLRLRHLGTDRLAWDDLWVLVTQMPREHDSALYRAVHPDAAPWGMVEQLLAEAVDSLHVANWQRGPARRKDYPKPIPRPGVESDRVTYGSSAVPMSEMASWLGWDTDRTRR